MSKDDFGVHIKARPFCSLNYWFPKIKDLPGVNTPKTIIVPLPEGVNVEEWYETGPDTRFVALLKSEAKPLGYPLFLRTDQVSGKHQWKRSCYVTKEVDMAANLRWVLEENFMASMMGEMDPVSICLREFLHLKTFFVCRGFGDMPVAKEFRCFATNGQIDCVHPYWPHGALVQGSPTNKDWEKLLPQLEGDTDVPLEMIRKVSAQFPEQWSIDVCQTNSGKWYVTDLALGSVSFHWKHGQKSGDDERLAEVLGRLKEREDFISRIKETDKAKI